MLQELEGLNFTFLFVTLIYNQVVTDIPELFAFQGKRSIDQSVNESVKVSSFSIKFQNFFLEDSSRILPHNLHNYTFLV